MRAFCMQKHYKGALQQAEQLSEQLLHHQPEQLLEQQSGLATPWYIAHTFHTASSPNLILWVLHVGAE